jgi:hypothetical protein
MKMMAIAAIVLVLLGWAGYRQLFTRPGPDPAIVSATLATGLESTTLLGKAETGHLSDWLAHHRKGWQPLLFTPALWEYQSLSLTYRDGRTAVLFVSPSGSLALSRPFPGDNAALTVPASEVAELLSLLDIRG